MASTAVRRDTLTFEDNVSYELVLKYATGKQISNGNIMFTTTMDQVFFLKPEAAQKIHALGLGINEPFEIVKRNGSIVVRRIEQQPEPSRSSNTPVAATAQTKPIPVTQPSQPQNNSLSGIMAASYIAAMDALLIAEQYATSKGIPFRLSMGELRASSHCIFIAMTRNMGGRF